MTDARVAAHSLVANVSRDLTLDGRGFYVGTSWKGTAPFPGTTAPAGRLFIGFNDRAVLCDRSGYDSWKIPERERRRLHRCRDGDPRPLRAHVREIHDDQRRNRRDRSLYGEGVVESRYRGSRWSR